MTGSTVPPAGAGGALADDDAADGDGITAGDAAAAEGGGAEVHCTSTTPAASISTSTAPHRLKDVNWDASSTPRQDLGPCGRCSRSRDEPRDDRGGGRQGR